MPLFLGHVLLHPKLKNPGNLKLNPAYDPTFPSIEVIEPDLRSIDITSLMSGNDKVGSFSTKVNILHTLSKELTLLLEK